VAAAGALWRSYHGIRVPLLCVRFFSFLIDVTDGYVVSVGAYLPFTHPCYVSSVSIIHGSIHRGTM
jgi:hypothetical protein